MIKLPKDTYKRDLLHWVYSLNVEDCDQKEYELLRKVCTCYIYNGKHNFQIDRIKITESDKVLIQERDYIHSENKEIRARFIDVAIRSGLYKKNKLELKRECSDLYLEIAEQQKDCSAFVRAVQVRDVRLLWNKDFIEKLVAIIKVCQFNPRWIVDIADKLKININTESSGINEILDFYGHISQDTNKLHDFQWQQGYVDMLHSLEVLNNDELHYKRALLHEAEGDYTIQHKEPNTLYPNLHQYFQNAFNEINQVKKLYPDDWKRIHDKLVVEKQEFVNLLSLAGINTRYEVSEDFQKQVRSVLMPKMNFQSTLDALLLLIDAPFFPASKEWIGVLRKKWCPGSPLMALCSNVTKLDSNGNTVGVNKNNAGLTIEIHRYIRLHLLYYLWIIVEHYQCLQLNTEEGEIYGILKHKNSKYVNDEQLILWAKSICAILNGEPLLGSYVLVPQIESLIRQLAEGKIGDMTKLADELQQEHTFGGILDKLRPYMPEDLNDELRLFLVDGCDENIRNEMMHGLIKNPMQVQKHSVYILYIALNLYFREDVFLFQD